MGRRPPRHPPPEPDNTRTLRRRDDAEAELRWEEAAEITVFGPTGGDGSPSTLAIGVSFTKGRIIVRGKLVSRDKAGAPTTSSTQAQHPAGAVGDGMRQSRLRKPGFRFRRR